MLPNSVQPIWRLTKRRNIASTALELMKTTHWDRNESQKNCARCGQTSTYSGDWYRDLCPDCADKTEGEWVCRHCNRYGNFEEMGGNGAVNPSCCGSRCKHIKA
jgi:hypothetical protein